MQEKAKIDGKGRLLLPKGIRRTLGLEAGSELVISLEGRRAVLNPVFDRDVVELRIVMGDAAGTLAKIAEFLSKSRFDIIMSESRSLERAKDAEWDVVGKYSGDLSSLVSKLKRMEYVKDVILKSPQKTAKTTKKASQND